MDEPILDYVKARLESHRGEWPKISRETGVPYFTITNIVQGKVEDPRVSTVQKLHDFFRSQEQAA
jgi:hypothetical protein